ncbi:L,D-transpeptidase family protein [Persephonella sp.]|uniref:L,D-transpeptidase family protein n=1 Tax=Persephonella sp. TaxID=2060922 RepID=UPI002634BE62|nr:L,D-transpeptidase family protein [Persephonella sp.]
MRYLLAFLLLISLTSAKELLYGNVIYLPPMERAIVVSKSKQKLIVVQLKNGVPEVVDSSIAITGFKFGDKRELGDMKTPEGVYFPKSYKSKSQLPAAYGIGAYPLNYPNALDKYIIHRNGDGIWIHATDKENPLFFSSKGCVILTNKDFAKISDYIRIGKTPVVIQENFVLLDEKKYKQLRKDIDNFLNRWKKTLLDIYKGKTDGIFSVYSPYFKFAGGDIFNLKKQFKKEFYSINNNEPFVHILNKKAFLDRRRNQTYYVIAFKLAYLSGDEIKSVNKVLYLIRDKGQLKIITEENL